ncbi:MAG: AbrB/MazE/SpoVT family DNA-binding domain-containing protein [Nanoarchaeota archaeon]|nr:AbrB/MazE/SpoVT family DNA-binding domain-containing protein [Nanoarchaeota archaeon]MBU0978137.1 AbrB/MazE/SpoVT family DNA-binding domain-containing protein [Nanoarchaeota archaeon]
MASLTRIRALGGSLAVTIPIELVRAENLKVDEVVEVEIKKHKKDYFGALQGLSKFTQKDRMEDRE